MGWPRFETDPIVLHLAQRHTDSLPRDRNFRARGYCLDIVPDGGGLTDRNVSPEQQVITWNME
ncbi:hypothetical protein NC00_03470 [Xanthomonas cannabis pv. phaseoli]|uniref:Uncharacterized protein n=1 Tax=Xanthomonas cannabis pv. phaseoli TaxID=1885902 RepID=A0AB34PD04_9XANT|nr:hypothetical protein NC00_03470 [Xanthomonas cannabis pv. phaseoli]